MARGGARSVEGGLHERFARARDRLYAHLADGQMQLPLHLLHAADGVTSLCHSDILSLEEIERVVRVAATMGIKRFRLTGGEPLVRKGAVDLVRAIHETPGVDDVSLTTNGVLLPKYAEKLASAGLSRVNISLDTLDPEQFRYITRRGELHEAIDGIEAALATGFDPVKVNAVTVRAWDRIFWRLRR